MTKRNVFLLATCAVLIATTILLIIYNLNMQGRQESYTKVVMGPTQIPWSLGGVVLDLGSLGSPDDSSVESPTIIKLRDNSYVMWYRGQGFADKTGRIMRSVSRDGINWTRTGVVMEPVEEYEGDKIDPMSVIYEDGVYKMWYGGDSYGGCACYAISADGISWTRYAGNPVLRKTSGSWDNEGAGGQHSVIKAGGRYYMFYKGYGKKDPGWTFYGRAESDDGINWLKKGKILSPDPEIGDTTIYRNLCAFMVDSTYCLMFTMVEYLDLFLASSQDGKTWNKHGQVFAHGYTPNGYDSKWSTSPCIIVEGQTIRMWYEGGDNNGRVRILYATTSKDRLFNALKNVAEKP